MHGLASAAALGRPCAFQLQRNCTQGLARPLPGPHTAPAALPEGANVCEHGARGVAVVAEEPTPQGEGSRGTADAAPALAKQEKSGSWSMCKRLLWKQRNVVPGPCTLLFPARPTVIIGTYNLLLSLFLAFV